jgi:hypothetical protein
MDQLALSYRLKDDSLGPPERYLGANVAKYQLPDGRECWSMSSRDYVKAAVKCVEDALAEQGLKLKGKADRPLPYGYRPEVDVSEELQGGEVSLYQQYIGVLRWACELGRVDILLEVALMSSHMAMPRRGHLEALYSIFAYLRKHEKSTLVFDDAKADVDERGDPTKRTNAEGTERQDVVFCRCRPCREFGYTTIAYRCVDISKHGPNSVVQ